MGVASEVNVTPSERTLERLREAAAADVGMFCAVRSMALSRRELEDALVLAVVRAEVAWALAEWETSCPS